jgi:hypothetical protein
MRRPRAILDALQLRWIGKVRIIAYSRILLFASLFSFYVPWRQAMGRTGSDFLAFWSAGRLVVTGAAARVYDLAATGAVQAGVGRENVFAFVNPPPFLLVVAPLGLLTYPAAWIAWIVVTYGLWLAVSRLLDRRLFWPIAAFPGALVAGWHAQTGLAMSALQGGAAVLLRRRPFAAGLCVGALICKPHLALLFPVAFIAGRQWRAFAGAAVGALGLVALSWLVFGTQTLLAYRQSWAVSRYLMDTGSAEFFLRQVTVYAAVRVAFTPLAATLAQGLVTLAVAGLVWRAWSGKAPLEAKLALLMAATPLATPYLFSYDLPFLIVPVIWLIGQARDRPQGGWERANLMFFYLSPLVARALALPLGANITPWVQMWMMWEVWRRMGGENGAGG